MKFIDLFCGAGGLSCGLEMAGFTPILANEIDPIFAATYKKNHPEVNIFTGDIKNINSTLLTQLRETNEKIDLIAGGPPCQGYSIIAPERSINDPRNHLFREYLRIVEFIKPRAVIIENVPGIISFEKGLIVKTIYKELNLLGYTVAHKILCAAHYGVPQIRFRTFFIALHNYKKSIKFPPPTHNAPVKQNFTNAKKLCIKINPLLDFDILPHVNVMDAIGDLPQIIDTAPNIDYKYTSRANTDFQEFARKDSSNITSHFCARLSDINRERIKHIPPGGSWRDIPFDLLPAGLKRAKRSDHTKRYGRLLPDGLCSTIQTKCDPHWGCFFHPFQERVISVREAARLQSFPDRIKFMGSLTQQYKQVGNAVPPLLGKAVGKCIAAMLQDN